MIADLGTKALASTRLQTLKEMLGMKKNGCFDEEKVEEAEEKAEKISASVQGSEVATMALSLITMAASLQMSKAQEDEEEETSSEFKWLVRTRSLKFRGQNSRSLELLQQKAALRTGRDRESWSSSRRLIQAALRTGRSRRLWSSSRRRINRAALRMGRSRRLWSSSRKPNRQALVLTRHRALAVDQHQTAWPSEFRPPSERLQKKRCSCGESIDPQGVFPRSTRTIKEQIWASMCFGRPVGRCIIQLGLAHS